MFIIRPATPSDADAMGRVHVQVWRETYPGIVPQKILDDMSVEARAKRWREFITNLPTDQFVWLAVDGGDIVGFCGGGPAREAHLGQPAEIFMINILKSGQKRGVGRALMQHAARSLISSGFQSAGLWVFVENHNARAFYRRLGGVETDIRQDVDFDGEKRPELAVHWAELSFLEK